MKKYKVDVEDSRKLFHNSKDYKMVRLRFLETKKYFPQPIKLMNKELRRKELLRKELLTVHYSSVLL